MPVKIEEINSKIQVWVVDSLQKAFPKTRKPKRSKQSIKLYSAGNETEDAQILIRPKLGLDLTKVSFTFSDLSSSESTISARVIISKVGSRGA